MSERQRRVDEGTANAVARGINIKAVRGSVVATRYMEHKRVPAPVIERVLADSGRRRAQSSGQAHSEAIAPTGSGPGTDK
jgi:hypothetical protein